jgi:hypothetical protein
MYLYYGKAGIVADIALFANIIFERVFVKQKVMESNVSVVRFT